MTCAKYSGHENTRLPHDKTDKYGSVNLELCAHPAPDMSGDIVHEYQPPEAMPEDTVYEYSDLTHHTTVVTKSRYSPWRRRADLHYYEVLTRPLIQSLIILGLVCERMSSKYSRCGSWQLWYHCTILVLVWANVIR